MLEDSGVFVFAGGGGGGKAGLVSNCVGELGFRGPGFRVP